MIPKPKQIKVKIPNDSHHFSENCPSQVPSPHFCRGRRTATIKADCVCDLRALTRAALLEALSQYPGDKEPEGVNTSGWHKWVAKMGWCDFLLTTSYEEMLGKKSVFLLDCNIFFQTSCSTAEIGSEEVMAKVESRQKESLILKAKCFFLLWLFQFLELKAENQQQSGYFPRWGISDLQKSLEPHFGGVAIFTNIY